MVCEAFTEEVAPKPHGPRAPGHSLLGDVQVEIAQLVRDTVLQRGQLVVVQVRRKVAPLVVCRNSVVLVGRVQVV